MHDAPKTIKSLLRKLEASDSEDDF
jgi:hypothetical protein